MKKLFLAAGVAALAIAAPATAEKGGKGGGKGGGGDRAAKVERGGGGNGGGHGGHKMQRSGGGGGQAKAFRADRRSGGGDRMKSARSDGGPRKQFAEQRFERSKKMNDSRSQRVKSDREQRFESGKRFAEQRSKGREKLFQERSKQVEKTARRSDMTRERRIDRDRNDNVRVARTRDWDDNVRVASTRDWDDFDRWENIRGKSYGCPPGLAAKGNGCMPPGQAKKLMGSVLPAAFANSYLPERLRSYYRDDDDYYYRYGDGYAYRVNRDNNLIAALLPLFGGSYALGQTFPLHSAGYGMPSYYSSFYHDTPDDYYRYEDGYLYEIDARTGLIEDVDPMLGYGYGVGQLLPAGYSAYNVPYQYRDMYYDTDDAYYRYAPGAIYQVDPQTNLITSVASLLTGTPMGIGQQLPMGYDVYNVPYAYRDRYYDTDDSWYRYADGNIYQVDPTTRLITAVIDAIV
jgi:hypothetical protein